MKTEEHKIIQPVDIVGTGFYVPERVVTNQDIEAETGIPSDWIENACRIKSRRVCSEEEHCSVLGQKAAEEAIKAAQIDPGDIDLIIVGTVTPDFSTPPTACVIQKNLGAKNAFSFDIEVACMSFIWGLNIAIQFIASNSFKTILVVGAEASSRKTNYDDKNTFILMGDGAGAAVVKRSTNGKGVLSSYFKGDGTRWEYATVLAGGSRHYKYHEDQDIGKYMFTMNGKGIFKFGVTVVDEIIKELLKKANVTIDEVALIIPHQANGRLLESAIKRTGIASDKFYINIQNYGNTSAATVAIAMAEAVQKGMIKDGDLVMLIGFGAGLNWGGILLKW